eukprot:TRINITY_DN1488_c0_g1_i1.p1 TRINITY_DN1488_c0_g1~~TRINITY_DN1488_c0_g1_i1.p1  ORF type:complete len:339 (+),score=100.53 TRINITY_DN1488_c0_g1_i1:99-1115(+)
MNFSVTYRLLSHTARTAAMISSRSSLFVRSHHTSVSSSSHLFSNRSLVRAYSTASTGSEKDVQHLVERDQFMKVRTKLEADPRRKIPYADFTKICTNEGLSESQSKELCKSLSNSGVVLHFPNSDNSVLRDTLYLKPQEFTTVVSRLLGQITSDTFLREQLEVKKAELENLKQEVAPLAAQREALQRKAHSRATTIVWLGLGYCVVQAAAVARLTWWELSWDVMEPVTYMLTFATALIGYSWFVATGTEYTYEGLMKSLEHRRLNKLIKKTGFNEAQYQKLSRALAMKQEDVERTIEQLEYHSVHEKGFNPATAPKITKESKSIDTKAKAEGENVISL